MPLHEAAHAHPRCGFRKIRQAKNSLCDERQMREVHVVNDNPKAARVEVIKRARRCVHA
jgi:hypothetical protein